MIRKLLCWLGFHESKGYYHWYKEYGYELNHKEINKEFTHDDYLSEVDGTMQIVLSTCRFCGRKTN